MSGEVLIAAIINGALNGGIYGLLALAIVLIFRSTDVSNFAQGEMASLAAFVFFLQIVPLGYPFWIDIILMIVASGVMGALIYFLILAPRPEAHHLNKTVRTLALFGVIFAINLIVWGGNEPYRVPSIFSTTTTSVFNVTIGYDQLSIAGITIGLAIVLLVIFRYTRAGLAMRAVAIDPTVASLLGVNVRRVTLTVWIMAGIIAAVVGLLVSSISFLETSLMRPYILKAFTAAIIGGLNSFTGALVGGVLLGIAEAIATVGISIQFREPFVFVLLLLTLLFRPGGLFGSIKKSRV